LKKWFSFFEPIIENQFNWSNSPDGTEILRAWAVAALPADCSDSWKMVYRKSPKVLLLKIVMYIDNGF
jgi:hypothetical protein